MPVNYFIITLVGFLSGIAFVFIFKRLSLRYRILIPQGIPLVGGISMGVSFILASTAVFFIYGNFSQKITGIIIASFIMLIFGIIDDLKELSIKAKFFVQIIATSLLILFGVRTQIVYIGNATNIIITFIWVLGITNAINHLDVIDGLAAGTALFASLGFFVICLFNGDTTIAALSLALAAAAFSFLIQNLPPAKIYMGNAGSHFLGFVLAAIALVISYAPLERKIALLSPLFILGLPIFDTAFLVLARVMKKNLPFKKSNDHLALKFLALGYSKKKALLTMLAFCFFFSVSGALLSQVSDIVGVTIIASLILMSLTLTIKMRKVVYK